MEALGIMLNEIQDNLGLLPEESQKRILQAAGFAIKQFRQRKAKAEIQRILKEDKGISETSSETSDRDETIFTEATISGETMVTNTEVWTTPEDFIPIIKHAAQYWTVCYDQACQTHRYKDHNLLPRANRYQCSGKMKS